MFEVRRATNADVAAITECVARAYEHYVPRIGGRPGPMLEDYEQVVAEREAYVAVKDATVVGVLVLGPSDEGFLVHNVAVRPEQRGKGLGRRLLTLAEERATAAGFDSIYLYTHENMVENRALYEKRGYVQYDERTTSGMTRVFMRKRL
jgi:ribosomal protein S18 acetylase RimI-like enzyme